MGDQYDRERETTAIAAAKILCSLRSRKLVRWPDWLPPPSTEEPAEARVTTEEPPPPPLPLLWPKRQRANGRPKAANAWQVSLKSLVASMGYGAPCGGEDGPAKRKPSGEGDEEECISPAKRARVDGDPAGQQATSAAADKVEEEAKSTRSNDNRDEKGCLLFDLNEDAPCDQSEDGFSW